MSTLASLPGRRPYYAIALLSGAVLLYEIAITRILSVVLWYHWAFLCISLAMLGLGAPGVWLSMSRRPERLLLPLVLLSALLLPLSLVLILKLGGHTDHRALLSMGCVLLPLLALGGSICLLLMQAPGRALGRMYGYDLAGACLGALLVIPLLWKVPTPQLVAGIGFLPLAAHVVLHRRVAPAAALLAVVLVGALVWGEPFALRYTKTYVEARDTKPIFERWTPTARLTVFDNIFWVRNNDLGFSWGRGSRATPVPVRQYWVEQDACAGTPLTQYSGVLSDYRYLLDDVTTVGYELRPPGRVALIGAGGGRDILTSLLVGARDVHAIELNGALVDLVSHRFGDFSGDVYHLPGVRAVVSEGRSFLTRSREDYDLISLSLVDSWAATTAGAYALSENNLYTLEAMRLYLRRLSPRGMLSVSRWLAGPYWVEVPRLVLLVQRALREEGVADPQSHIAVAKGGSIGTVLVSRAPFGADELAELSEICARRGFVPLFPPMMGVPPDNMVAAMLTYGPAHFPLPGARLDAPTDDKPFFFQVLSPFRRVEGRDLAKNHGVNAEAVYVLQRLMLAVAAGAVALFFLPFPLYRWFKRHPGYWRGSLFFGCIGLAFMLVEIPWLQRFILYLGHPSYATTVVLAALLLGASLGSLNAERIGLQRVQRFGLLLPGLLLVADLALHSFFSATLGWSLGLRAVLTCLLLLPIAFLMGLFFPLGMLRFGDGNKPWFWAVNGAASVLASVASLALSMEFGFTRVAAIGAVFYLLAVVLIGGQAQRVKG
jgi:hypothetical protein